MRGLPGLKHIRQRSGFTQEQLAKLIGVSIITISRYELGRQNARFSVVEKLAQVLKCSEIELLYPEVSGVSVS